MEPGDSGRASIGVSDLHGGVPRVDKTGVLYPTSISLTTDHAPSPRCRPDEPFLWKTLWYPYLGIIRDLSPDCFARSVAIAKRQAESDPKKPSAILINAWNEYTEGSYLMPDEKNGDAYLKALRRALGIPPKQKGTKQKGTCPPQGLGTQRGLEPKGDWPHKG